MQLLSHVFIVGNFGQIDLWAVWQYGLWSFQTGGTKLERFLPKNQYTQRKLLNFENWVNGEVSKIRSHFRNKSRSILRFFFTKKLKIIDF